MRVQFPAIYAALACFVLSPASGAVTFGATSTLTGPMSGQVYHTGSMANTASVTVTGSSMKVTITGATANQMFNVQWSMQLEVNGSPLSGTIDAYNGLIQCDSIGMFSHTDTALMTKTFSQPIGNYSATAYVDFFNNNNAANKANQSRSASYSVVLP